VSDWLDTETYSPAAIETAPPIRAETPVSSRVWKSGAAAATPVSSEAVEIRPSFAPNTLARSQLLRLLKWRSLCCEYMAVFRWRFALW
jgi:hypothetical protein